MHDAPRPRLDDVLAALRASARPAFHQPDGAPVSAAGFDHLVAGTARWLTDQGLRAGDCVAAWLPNRLAWPAILFASARLGLRVAAVNTRYRTHEVEHILHASGASLLIAEPAREDAFDTLAALDPSRLPSLRRVALAGDEGVNRTAPLPYALHTLRRRFADAGNPFETAAYDPKPQPGGPDADSDPEAPLLHFATSGTTSAPKLVTHPQRTLALHALRCAPAFGFDAPDAAFLAAMPFCGTFGLASLLGAMAGGAPVHLLPEYDTAPAAARLHAGRITHVFGSDEMFRRLQDHDPASLSHARLCGFAAFAPGAAPALRKMAEAGVPLRGLYGSSEVHALFGIQPGDLPLDQRLEGGGRPASADAQLRIRDPETGDLVTTGKPGELEIRAPTSFTGYHGNPDATAKALTQDGFFRTGDLARLRGDGTFVYIARMGDAIRLSGFLTDPAEIEEALKGLPGIGDAQVVGVEVDGALRPVAFVIPDGAFDEAAARAEAAARLAHYKVPVRIFPIDAFPTTPSANGVKIRKAALREDAQARLAAASAG